MIVAGKPHLQRAVHLIGGALILVIALWGHQLRWANAPASFDPNPVAAPAWLIDDPDAAYHLRRVQIALAGGEVPDSDRFLSHPGGSPVPWPPLFDGVLALSNSLATGRPGAMGVSDDYEAGLEARAAAAPPLLGLFATLAVALAAALFVRRVRPHPECLSRGYVIGPTVAAVLAALCYATSPIAVWYGAAGRIDHHVLIAFLLALHLGVMAQIFVCGLFESDRSLAQERSLDATLGGLSAGVIAGFALLTWLASAIFVALAGLTFWVAAAGSRSERVVDARRAGMLYFAAAGVVTFVPAWLSPWNEVQPWSLVNLTRGVPISLFVASFALTLPCWLPGQCVSRELRGLRERWIGSLVPPLVVLLAYFAMPGFREGVQEGLAWASRGNLFMDVVGESRPLVEVGGGVLLRGLLVDLGWAGAALGIIVLWLIVATVNAIDRTRGGLRAEARFYLFLNLCVFAYLAIEQRRFGNSLAVPLAVSVGCVGGLTIGRIENCYTKDLTSRAVALAGLVISIVLGYGAISQGRALANPDPAVLADTRDWRREVIGGLRWMRTETPSPGPWDLAEAAQDYCVLSSWTMGHLIEYHARRPVVATNFGSFVGEENFRASAQALLERDPARFDEALEALGADYVVVTPRIAGELASQTRIAGLAPAERSALFTKQDGKKTYSALAAETAAWRLALDTPGSEPSYPGLVRVYASTRRESIFGGNKPGPSGPVLSIWMRAGL